jgi:hypothetical protein
MIKHTLEPESGSKPADTILADDQGKTAVSIRAAADTWTKSQHSDQL